MRSRRPVTIVLSGSLLLAAFAPPVAAAEPADGRGYGRDSLPALSGDSVRKVRGDRGTQSAPGDTGGLAFVQSPYLGWPGRLYTMTAAGTDDALIPTPAIGQGVAWPQVSPGGVYVAYSADQTSTVDTSKGDIFVAPYDGSAAPRRITDTATDDQSVDWTPDGARLLFTSNRTGNYELYSIRIDGTGLVRLTTNAAADGSPSVSPDGKRVAFTSDRNGNFDIYTMNIDGSGVTRLTTSSGGDVDPDWSPDGSKIAFSSTRTGDFEIFSMSANGSNQTNLTGDPTYHDIDPSWSPDGAQIAFWAISGGDADIWTMASTGGEQFAVGATSNDEWAPDWQPIPDFPLVDARFSTFKGDIEWVYAEGITAGCSPERYCPDSPVTREQMAIFLDRALDLPSTATDFFSDDAGRTGEAAINRVAAAGITSGCGPNLYCPTANVSRGQMASFLARAFNLPTTTTDYFTDDDGTTHEANINRIRLAGITTGCTATTYCPTANVTRGQMAAFLRRALE
jgi:hypothetical protein